MKTFNIRTLGCKVNQCDSQEIRKHFLSSGWQERDNSGNADVCIVNTCCVTHNADSKSRNAIRSVVRSSRRAKVFVTGCYTDYDKNIFKSINGIDGIFTRNEKNRLYDVLSGKSPKTQSRLTPPAAIFSSRTRAFLKIQDGCNNRCSYCVVPLVRGPSKSNPRRMILKEARSLVASGHKEIVLTGVCLGSYGRDLKHKTSLVDLLGGLEKIDGLLRLRLSSIEAADVNEELIDLMSRSKKIMPHLHIPFQSGDDAILASMNKKLRNGDYLKIARKAKNCIKDLAITCDMIVGYPQEADKNFYNSVGFLKEVEPLRTHIFSFSKRVGTVAGGMSQQVLPQEVKKRFATMQEVALRLRDKYIYKYMDKTVDVLFEDKQPQGWSGYSENYIRVTVKSDTNMANCLLPVRIYAQDKGLVNGRVEKSQKKVENANLRIVLGKVT